MTPSSAFIQEVLARRPALAAFDCDGTLWAGDAGADFFYWEIERGLVSREVADWALRRYDEYKAGRVDELTMCGEMVTMHQGLAVEKIEAAACEFFETVVAPRIFPELLTLTRALAEQGCEIWAVSSTCNWVIEPAVKRFGIPANRVLAASVECPGGKASAELVRVPTDELKATAIHEVIQRDVQAVFGNSIHDLAMMELARDAYAVNPRPELAAEARVRGWTLYWPDAVRR